MRRHRKSWIAACVLVVSLATAGAAPARTHAHKHHAPKPQRVPLGYFGAILDGPMFPPAPGVNLAQQLDVMERSGVESIRVQIDWASIQPFQSWSDVPPDQRGDLTNVDGLPLRLASIDQLATLCAQRGLSLRPNVSDAPVWDTDSPPGVAARTPRSYAPYGAFLKALIDRYGPHGSLWNGHVPKLPIRSWEVWNEPNIAGYWSVQPNFEPSYVALLRVAHDAIKSADPGATVILAGMVNHSWDYIARIYRIPGARRLFDVVAVHPYTHYPAGVLTILGYVRHAMDAAGDRRKPMVADELGWNSSLGKSPDHFGVEVTEAVQARDVATVLPMLARQRTRLRLMGLDYYTWAGLEDPGGPEFDFGGLFRFSGGSFIAKPVFGVYRRNALAQERCRQKGSVAFRCRRPF
ncbi:MAG: hypothetical protein M3Z27_07230 [Actinomycetota bacterium]|nr:hypothetical protein [Actinomycetota bacterium]